MEHTEVKSDFMVELQPDIHIRLLTLFHAHRKEFSGLGWVRQEGKRLIVYDFVLLDMGNEVFTEIPAKTILPLLSRPDKKNMKCWIHCHPMGDGIPGRHNWSGTDNDTITMAPLGTPREMMTWSLSIVLTLGGFVARLDKYKDSTVAHLPVVQPTEAYAEARKYRATKTFDKAFNQIQIPDSEEGWEYEEEDFDKENRPEGETETSDWLEIVYAVADIVDQFGDMPLNTPIVNSALWPAEIKQIADKYGHGVTLAQILEQEK